MNDDDDDDDSKAESVTESLTPSVQAYLIHPSKVSSPGNSSQSQSHTPPGPLYKNLSDVSDDPNGMMDYFVMKFFSK